MENPNSSSPRPPEDYGWHNGDSPKPKKEGGGKRILLAVAGVTLILAGIYGLVGTALFSVSSTTRQFAETQVEVMIDTNMERSTENSAQTVEEVTWAIENMPGLDESEYVVEESRLGSSGSVLKTQAELGSVNDIDINVAAAELIIKGYDGVDLDISINTYNNVKYYVETSGDTVVIDNDRDYGTPTGKQADRIVLNVPFDYKGNIQLTAAAGKVDISNISGDQLDMKIAAGSVNLDNISYKELTCEMAAGSVKGNGVSADNLDIQAGSGEIKLKGDLGDTDCESAAAAVTLVYNTMPETINIDGSLGTVDLYLPGDAEFSLINNAKMGTIASDFVSFEDSENEIEINMTMGTANIHKK